MIELIKKVSEMWLFQGFEGLVATSSFSFADEYVKYFAWKYEWRVDYRAPICKLCELLHEQVTTTSVDLEYIANTAGCRSGQEYPWMIQSMADEIEERNKEAEEKLLKERQVMAKRLKSRGKNRHTK